jgi:hypothetical protein
MKIENTKLEATNPGYSPANDSARRRPSRPQSTLTDALDTAKETGYLVVDEADASNKWFQWCEQNKKPYVLLRLPTRDYPVIRCEWDLIAFAQGVPCEVKDRIYSENRSNFFRICEDYPSARSGQWELTSRYTVTSQGCTYAVITYIRPDDACAVAVRMVEIATRNLAGLLEWHVRKAHGKRMTKEAWE